MHKPLLPLQHSPAATPSTLAPTRIEELFQMTERIVFPMALRFGYDNATCEDLAHDVFLKVFLRIGSFRGESALGTWIYRVAANELHDEQRWRRRHGAREVSLDSDTDHARRTSRNLVHRGSSPLELVLRRERERMIAAGLPKVNPLYREALLLRLSGDFSHQQIADRLDISVAMAKYRVFHGRRQLRELIIRRKG
jgi:RNA polymerase sigma-70 factor (ECF subfamily)